MKYLIAKLFFASILSASAESNNLDCKRPTFFDPISSDEIAVSQEELKSGKKRLETIDYVETSFNSKKIRLYANGDIKDSDGKKYGAIKGLGEFNWARAYKFNNALVLRPGYSDGVDINSSSLYLLAPKTFELVTAFKLPCMHHDEKLFVFSSRITYACRYEVEKNEGLVHSYYPTEKRWNEIKSSKNWDFFEREKDLKQIDVKKMMKFWKQVELSDFEKRCE